MAFRRHSSSRFVEFLRILRVTTDTSQGAGSVMCSYQRINNSYACHNSKSQNGLLKTELGFEGFIVSDWRAQRK